MLDMARNSSSPTLMSVPTNLGAEPIGITENVTMAGATEDAAAPPGEEQRQPDVHGGAHEPRRGTHRDHGERHDGRGHREDGRDVEDDLVRLRRDEVHLEVELDDEIGR